MYKLYKTFNAKAKQLAKERGKGGGAKEETEDIYAPIKMTTSIQNQIKQFKVCTENTWIILKNWVQDVMVLQLE